MKLEGCKRHGAIVLHVWDGYFTVEKVKRWTSYELIQYMN